jgi:DNA (cytosine-5)-methyltransferase 1
VENSPVLTSRGLGTVLGDLAEMGYYAQWGVLGACDVGAPHKRERIWILANSNLYGVSERIPATGQGGGEVGIHDSGVFWGSKDTEWPEAWGIKPLLGRGGDGMASIVDRLHAIGNGQVPAVAALAWETLAGAACMVNARKERGEK